MKKYVPFIFPAVALIIVLFLVYRFYRTNGPDQATELAEFGEGVSIEELTDSEQNQVLRGVGDFQTITMVGSDDVAGQIRYEIVDGRVRFSVMANMPELEQGNYQVWLEAIDGSAIRKAFMLEYIKGGFSGSAAISEATLPFRVVISRELSDDNKLEQRILEAELQLSTGSKQ